MSVKTLTAFCPLSAYFLIDLFMRKLSDTPRDRHYETNRGGGVMLVINPSIRSGFSYRVSMWDLPSVRSDIRVDDQQSLQRGL